MNSFSGCADVNSLAMPVPPCCCARFGLIGNLLYHYYPEWSIWMIICHLLAYFAEMQEVMFYFTAALGWYGFGRHAEPLSKATYPNFCSRQNADQDLTSYFVAFMMFSTNYQS